jgi:excisionase family DNA binding protein
MEMIDRLTRIEEKLDELARSLQFARRAKEWYTTAEVADLLGKDKYTVREWCRERRVRAVKRQAGRGKAKEWNISSEEVDRIRNQGLLPSGHSRS